MLGKKFRIEKGELGGAAVNLKSDLLGEKSWKLDTIEMNFKEMGGGKSMRADQILSKSLQRILEEVVTKTTGVPALPGISDLLGK